MTSWTEENRAMYVYEMRELKKERREVKTIKEEWKDLKEAIQKAIVKKEVKIKVRKIGDRRWWDKECAKKKN